MTGKMPISSPIVNDSDLWAAGPDSATGVYPKLWNYTGAHIAPKSVDFAKKYQAKYGQPPEVEAWQDWFGCTAILTAIRETKSTDTMKLIQFLEQHKFEGYKDMPIWFRDFDHQLIQPTLVVEVKKNPPDKYDYFNVVAEYPQNAADLDKYFGSKEEIGCKMAS
jgi:branched-chain amino acid transport system substrate-binding protein